MLNVKSVFVLGAGASVEVGLPTGAELTKQIANMLDLRWEHHHQTLGDRQIAQALIHRSRQMNGDQSWDITQPVHAARRISGAMIESLSIDNYMEAHSGDENVMLVGKMAIARAISMAERKSKLYTDVRRGEEFDPSKTKETWYHKFWQLLHHGVSATEPQKVFENLTVISFNYDRCLQQRLFFGLKNYYGLDNNSAETVLKSLNIHYPYGSLGQFTGPLCFGEELTESRLLEVSEGIKTFSERIDDLGCLEAIRTSIAEAERVVLLGFAFHPQNMHLMAAADTAGVKATYATAYGIPPTNLAPIRQQLLNLVGRQHEPVIDFGSCNDFFYNQWYYFI